ncbi:MAG: mechanosensitive ion channel family protein [Planctomycetes bacterium]|nr:mechanosensitive ion channel family protein [Planctomycetota bacterium]
MTASVLTIIASSDSWKSTISYEIIKGNAIWRFALVLLVILVTMALGRIMQYGIESYARRREEKRGVSVVTLILKCLSKPLYVAIFALGLFVCKLFLYFDDQEGIHKAIGTGWIKIAKSVGAIALAYGLFRLVDVIEYYLNRWAAKTATKLDDMLVPVIRKSLRITIAIIATLFIAETILGAGQIKTILLSAGVGGIAIALAAKDTIANFFGSVTIFADRPFQIDELVRIGEHLGPVEEVGFRSTKIRTLQGHLVTVPNSVIVNSAVENVGRRPFIRRTSNITITYDSGQRGAERAVEIIKEVLSNVPEINTAPENPPRVYFSDFNDWSLNIYVSYWVRPPDYWLYQEVNERVNLEIMKRFEAEQIAFAFPSQTLYIEKG